MALVLFDFSLAHTPMDNMCAGTPPYLDPFLRRCRLPRWDLYVERFAMAMPLWDRDRGEIPRARQAAQLYGARRSVLTRSPAFWGMSEGAATQQS